MIVILEGPRGVGKTTISRRLFNELTRQGKDVTIYKVERSTDPHTDMLIFIKTAARSPHIWIVDRFHLTEYVMSMFHQRRPSFELLASTDQIDRALVESDAVGVILDADDRVLAQRIAERADHRGPEMPPEESRKLWQMAGMISLFSKMRTDSPKDTSKVITYLARRMK